MSDTIAELLAEIDAFLLVHGMSETAFGLAVANDGHLIRELRQGRDPRVSMIDRARAFMRNHLNDSIENSRTA